MTIDATQIPDGWQAVRLETLAEVVMGQSPPGDTVVDFEGDHGDDGGLPFIQGNAEFGLRSPAPAKWCVRPLKVAEPGDLLISVRAPVGHTNRADQQLAIGRGLAAVRFTAADPSFGWHTVNYAKNVFERVAQGSTFEAIGGTELRSLPILLPPLPEQRAIAAVLDGIDEAIERTEEVIAATERLRDSLLHELLTRGLPGRHSEWVDVPGLGTVPACWDIVRLGDAVDVRSGQMDPRDAALQQLMFIAPDDIESATGRLISRRTVADARAISGKYEFDEQDVIYSKIRPYLMKVYLPEERGLCSADVYPIRPRAGLIRGYLALVLLSPRFTEYARTCSDRTGIPKINRRELLQFRLLLPSEDEQEGIAAVEAALQQEWDAAGEQLKALRDLKASVSDRLLTGHVRVPRAIRDRYGEA